MLKLEGVATKPHLLTYYYPILVIIQSYYYLNLLSLQIANFACIILNFWIYEVFGLYHSEHLIKVFACFISCHG